MVRSSHARAGLSYLEVLISASIALVGLLGAIAIIPLAARNIERGRIAETMIHVGESAIGRFQIEGFNNVKRWRVSANGARVPSVAPLPASAGGYVIDGIVDANDNRYGQVELRSAQSTGAPKILFAALNRPATGSPTLATPTKLYVTNQTAICFDPRMLAEASERGTAAEPDVELFPPVPFSMNAAIAASEARMLRVSCSRSNDPTSSAIDQLGAANIVRANDDLIVFRTQNDSTIPGKQSFFGPPIMNGTDQMVDPTTGEPLVTPQFRDTLGEFEWIATLVPKAQASGSPIGEYVLSIVVIHDRPRRLSPILQNTTTAAITDNFVEAERLLSVSFPGGGYGGGDITLTPRAGRPNADLQVSEGDWVLLSAQVTEGPLFSWYRVMNAGELNGNSVDVTLQGGDWPANRTTQAVILSNVVGVFERTIRVDTNSQW